MSVDPAPAAPETLEARRHRLYDYKLGVTAKISDICRFIGLGLIAVFYTIKLGSSAGDIGTVRGVLLYVVGLCGVAALLLDYLQYANNFLSVEDALKRDSLRYDKKAFSYRLAEKAFIWKQRATFVGAMALILLVILT